jgi:organic hydroperoxide reductase OsmC/OhrA
MLKIGAAVKNTLGSHEITLSTNDRQHSISIPPRPTGYGSSANGGELLFLALATCYCNDIYREAAKRNITIRSVHVEVSGEFGEAPGSAAENLTYSATVEADASEADIEALMRHTDTVAEIQNTLRQVTGITLIHVTARSIRDV